MGLVPLEMEEEKTGPFSLSTMRRYSKKVAVYMREEASHQMVDLLAS